MSPTHTLSEKMTQKQFRAFWKTLPEPERKFFRTMVVMQTALGLTDLHYTMPPPEMEQRLKRYDRNQLFSIVADCVSLLTRTPAIERVKEVHRRRGHEATEPRSDVGKKRS